MKGKYYNKKFEKEMIMDSKKCREMANSNMKVKDLNRIIKGKNK